MTEEFIYTYIVPAITFIIVYGAALIVGLNELKFFDDKNKRKRNKPMFETFKKFFVKNTKEDNSQVFEWNTNHIYDFYHKYYWKVIARTNPENTREYQIDYPGNWEVKLNDKFYRNVEITLCKGNSNFVVLHFSWDYRKNDVTVKLIDWSDVVSSEIDISPTREVPLHSPIYDKSINQVIKLFGINASLVKNILFTVTSAMRSIYKNYKNKTYITNDEKQYLITICESIFEDLVNHEARYDLEKYKYDPNSIMNKLVTKLIKRLETEYDEIHDSVYHVESSDLSKIDWHAVRDYLHAMVDSKMNEIELFHKEPAWGTVFDKETERNEII